MSDSDTQASLATADFRAGIFDLDGVLTQTARLHADAWKVMFDRYLRKRTDKEADFVPFDLKSDYRQYVDGRPRYEGVQCFLESRGIHLPFGDPNDSPDKETVCGLGNRKNELFQHKLKADGVSVYGSSLAFIRALREAGVKTAVVSSSRNCKRIVEAANIAGLFETRVDGMDLQQLGLAGKPAPDMFIEAARRLGSPATQTFVLEDATAGVRAADHGGFGCVIGVDRQHAGTELRAAGADIVVADLGEIVLDTRAQAAPAPALPNALDHVAEIVAAAPGQLAVFLDYDGTLTPIVERPEDAELPSAMHAALGRLADLCELAILSGRDLDDIRRRVDIEHLAYAGSHGFDICLPGGQHLEHKKGKAYLPTLDVGEKALRSQLSGIEGVQVERKRFAIAVHYRQVAETRRDDVKAIAAAIAEQQQGLRTAHGKMIVELQPDIEWDKGKALEWVLDKVSSAERPRVPVYIGDDTTDEDAFRAIADRGYGIRVAREPGDTRARFFLPDSTAVQHFLNHLIVHLKMAGHE